MSRMTKWLTLSLTIFALAACGKSEQQKASERIDNLDQERMSIASDIRSQAIPNVSWSDDQLNRYEAKLQRLDSIENQLRDESGKNGIIVTFRSSHDSILILLAHVRKVRAQKHGLACSTPDCAPEEQVPTST